jgi:hypothetical protein
LPIYYLYGFYCADFGVALDFFIQKQNGHNEPVCCHLAEAGRDKSHKYLFEYIDESFVVQIKQQGKTNGESKQPQYAKQLSANEQAHQSNQWMQSKLGPTIFGSMIFRTTVTNKYTAR